MTRYFNAFRRAIVRGIILAVIAFSIVALMLLFIENRFIFAPRRDPQTTWEPPTPQSERVEFRADDGTALCGWYMPHPRPRAVVLFACGNGGNMSYWAEVFHLLHDRLQLSLMAFDYRGYGLSQGSPSEKGVLQDARAARRWIAEREGIDERQVVLMGRSIGGAVAIDLAQDGCRALVVESTFTTLPEVAARVVPYFPVRYIMRTRFNSLSKIRRYDGPLLVSHGTADELVPYEMGRKLFDECPSGVKKFFTVREGTHNESQPAEYYGELARFLDALPQ